MAYYPSIQSLIETGKGKNLVKVYRSYRSILSEMIYFAIALVAVVLINLFFAGYSSRLRWLSVIPLGLLLNIFRIYYNDIVHLDRQKITQFYGRLSLNYEIPSIKYIDIRAINVEQDIIGRIFDYGNVELGTAGAQGYELTIHGVRAPKELADLINELRSANYSGVFSDPDGLDIDRVIANGE